MIGSGYYEYETESYDFDQYQSQGTDNNRMLNRGFQYNESIGASSEVSDQRPDQFSKQMSETYGGRRKVKKSLPHHHIHKSKQVAKNGLTNSLQGQPCQAECRKDINQNGPGVLLHPSHLDALVVAQTTQNGVIIGMEDSFMTDGSLVKNDNNIFQNPKNTLTN